MIYPKKSSGSTPSALQTKRLAEREKLKALAYQTNPEKYFSNTVSEKPQNLAASTQQTVEALTAANVEKMYQSAHPSHREKTNITNNDQRDDISIASKMSGATDFMMGRTSTQSKKANSVIDLNLGARIPQKSGYRNEEEEWADIYKHNQKVYKAEEQLEVERKALEKIKFRHELEVQVLQKEIKKQKEIDEKQVELAQVMKVVRKEEAKEQRRIDNDKAKVLFEKEMRDKQIKEIHAQRKAEVKEEKLLDRQIVKQIREEQRAEEHQVKVKKIEEQAAYRKTLLDNEVKRAILAEEIAKEKKAETEQMIDFCRKMEERDQQRENDAKARDAHVRGALEAGRKLVGKPKDDRERRVDEKVQKWAIKKEIEDREAVEHEQLELLRKKMEAKNYLSVQIAEQNKRRAQENEEAHAQAKIWHNSSAQFVEYEKQKDEYRKQQMKTYATELKQQMAEKFEERRVYDRLFDMRQTLYDKKRSLC